MNRLMGGAFCLLLMTGCTAPDEASSLHAGGSRIGLFKGIDAITEMLRIGTIHPDDRDNFDFRKIVDEGNVVDPLSPLLGAFVGGSGDSKMDNDEPHSISMMLWKGNFEKLAKIIALNCQHPDAASIKTNEIDVRLHPRFAAALLSSCASLNESTEVSDDIWNGVMGWEAPAAELEAWKIFLSLNRDAINALSAEERLSMLLMSLFLNPYFLLET